MHHYYLIDDNGNGIDLGEHDTLGDAEDAATEAMAQGPDEDWSDWYMVKD